LLDVYLSRRELADREIARVVSVCGGEVQLLSKCPLESLPSREGVTGIVRPLLLLKRRRYFKTRKSLRKNKNMVMGSPMGSETKIYCAGESQQ
jgi:hypothetical protein